MTLCHSLLVSSRILLSTLFIKYCMEPLISWWESSFMRMRRHHFHSMTLEEGTNLSNSSSFWFSPSLHSTQCPFHTNETLFAYCSYHWRERLPIISFVRLISFLIQHLVQMFFVLWRRTLLLWNLRERKGTLFEWGSIFFSE
jgi:hypothetical protein